MADRIISASDFKARCLALLDRVAETGDRIIVTKHGQAVAQVMPLERDSGRKPLEGSGTILMSEDELVYFSAGEGDADAGNVFGE